MASQSDPQVLVRSQPAHVRVVGQVCLVLGPLLVLLAVGLGVAGEVVGAVVCSAAGVLLAWLALACLRPRVGFDATGIHVRGLLGSRDLPWPASREVLVSSEQYVRMGRTVAVAQYRPADGSRPVTMGSLRCTRGGEGSAASAVDAELDEVWAWAVDRGYVRSVDSASDPAAGADPAAADGALIDQDLLDRQYLVLKGRSGAQLVLLIGAPFAALLLVTGLSVVVTGESILGGVGAIVLGGLIALAVVDTALARTVVDRDGIHVTGLARRNMPWPSSRQQLVALVGYNSRSVDACGYLVAPDGKHHQLTVLGRKKDDLAAELDAVRTLDTIWAWGVRHGVAHETQEYVQAAVATFERRRRVSAERICHLWRGRVSRSRTKGWSKV